MTGHLLSPANRIIVTLDVASETEALDLINRLPQVNFWKVGLELFVSAGPNILKRFERPAEKNFSRPQVSRYS